VIYKLSAEIVRPGTRSSVTRVGYMILSEILLGDLVAELPPDYFKRGPETQSQFSPIGSMLFAFCGAYVQDLIREQMPGWDCLGIGIESGPEINQEYFEHRIGKSYDRDSTDWPEPTQAFQQAIHETVQDFLQARKNGESDPDIGGEWLE